jgi:hypothetical protein
LERLDRTAKTQENFMNGKKLKFILIEKVVFEDIYKISKDTSKREAYCKRGIEG